MIASLALPQLTACPLLALTGTGVALQSLVVAAGLLTVVWIISVRMRDAGIVDLAWGMGFVVIAWTVFFRSANGGQRAALLCGLVTLWGVRLSGYLFWRNAGKEEDYRYAAMRKKHGERFWIVSLGTVFWLQAVIMWVVSFPIQFGQLADRPWSWLDGCGVALFIVGLFFETIGDWQLARFKLDPANRGKALDTGLWRYTRHPNYFGDFCVWWGLYLVAASGGAWWTFFGPLAMSFFLIKVSGVAMLESTIVERRPEYAAYIRRTNAFFPGPPRRSE